MTQTSLAFAPAAPDTAKHGCRECIRRILTGSPGRRWTLYELGAVVEARTGTHYSATTISAKVRDLRKPSHGALDVRCEPRPGARGIWEVWLA